jgi:hypothetical protein
MLALSEALAAYRDGWTRVGHAPRILALLVGATILVTVAGPDGAPASHPLVLDVFEPLGTALMGGTLAAALEASDVTGRLGGESAPWLLWLLVVVGGVVLTGGVMDRFARQRPLDARTFWGVTGELSFRLIRLSAIGGLIFTVMTGVLVIVLDAIANAILGAAGPERTESIMWLLEIGLRIPYLAAAFTLFAATDIGRVRMVVERRRSALFALTAGARFAWRHRGPVLVLYALLFATAGIPWAAVSAAELWLEPGTLVARLLDAVQVTMAITAALVAAAAATSIFQGALAHATYVGPPRLVWPDSPAIETLADPAPRDFPPAV